MREALPSALACVPTGGAILTGLACSTCPTVSTVSGGLEGSARHDGRSRGKDGAAVTSASASALAAAAHAGRSGVTVIAVRTGWAVAQAGAP